MHALLYDHIISKLPDKWVEKSGGAYYKLMAKLLNTPMVEIPVDIAGISFPNPVGMPAGWIDNPSKLRTIRDLGAGILTIKTITVHPKTGNPYPRIVRLEQGMINSLGLPNQGVDWWKANYSPPDFPVIISIKGNTLDEWEQLINALECKTQVFELNLSCPNVGNGIMDIKLSKQLVEDISGITTNKIFLKISPEFSALQNLELVTKVRDEIDGITAINTLPVKSEKLGNPTHRGGLSGTKLFPVLKNQLGEIRADYPRMNDLPILATGGIFTGVEAWEIISDFASIPMGLTGMLLYGPKYYVNLANHIKEELDTRSLSIDHFLYD